MCSFGAPTRTVHIGALTGPGFRSTAGTGNAPEGDVLPHPVLEVSGLQPGYNRLQTKMSTNLPFMHLSHDVRPEGARQHNFWVELGVVQAVEPPNQ